MLLGGSTQQLQWMINNCWFCGFLPVDVLGRFLAAAVMFFCHFKTQIQSFGDTLGRFRKVAVMFFNNRCFHGLLPVDVLSQFLTAVVMWFERFKT